MVSLSWVCQEILAQQVYIAKIKSTKTTTNYEESPTPAKNKSPLFTSPSQFPALLAARFSTVKYRRVFLNLLK